MVTAEKHTRPGRMPAYTATRNACKLCAPLGACLAFRGVEGAVPFLHGSQGCSTYIRRYMISHFREPMDIACSNFGEATAIFGGKENLRLGLDNVMRQYQPQLIGIATTCLAETIGDDVGMFLHQIRREAAASNLPPIVSVSTPAYAATHIEGFHATVRALVNTLAEPANATPTEPAHDPAEHSGETPSAGHVNLMPGIVSPADIRYLRELFADFQLPVSILPDYSDTLDGPAWEEYARIPPGGTPIAEFRRAGAARASIEFGASTAGELLEQRFGVARHQMPMPIGVCLSDGLFDALERISGRPTPARHQAERGRLVDAMVDAHKYVAGKRAVVCGEPDLVVGLAGMLAEIGVVPAICATGARNVRLAERLAAVMPEMMSDVAVLEDHDFTEIEERAAGEPIDLIVGNSKGFKLAQRFDVPLVRVGFPVHDRIGGPRLLHVGYRGAQQLFDRVANALIEAKQSASPVGYTYM